VDREVYDKDNLLESHDVRYFLSSLDPGKVTPSDLQKLVRDHWQVETSLHFVKDRWWEEDRHYLERPGLGQAWIALTNAALSVLRLLQIPGQPLTQRRKIFTIPPEKPSKYSVLTKIKLCTSPSPSTSFGFCVFLVKHSRKIGTEHLFLRTREFKIHFSSLFTHGGEDVHVKKSVPVSLCWLSQPGSRSAFSAWRFPSFFHDPRRYFSWTHRQRQHACRNRSLGQTTFQNTENVSHVRRNQRKNKWAAPALTDRNFSIILP
jgi:hypothetical protein